LNQLFILHLRNLFYICCTKPRYNYYQRRLLRLVKWDNLLLSSLMTTLRCQSFSDTRTILG
jgi:hypothetical protein